MSKKSYPFPPAYLRREAAAYYVSVSPRQLDKWVEEKKVSRHQASQQIFLFERSRLEAEVARICGIETNEATQEEPNVWDDVLQ
jgi:hypothetical protein